MRSCMLAFAMLLAGATAAIAAVFPLDVTITEVNDARLAVSEGDVFTGEIRFDPVALASSGLAPVDAITLDFDGVVLTEGRAERGLALFELGAGNLGLAMTVRDVRGVFGFAGEFDFLGLGANTVGFVDETGTVALGEFVVTPLPAALPLLATSLLGLAWWSRRR